MENALIFLGGMFTGASLLFVGVSTYAVLKNKTKGGDQKNVTFAGAATLKYKPGQDEEMKKDIVRQIRSQNDAIPRKTAEEMAEQIVRSAQENIEPELFRQQLDSFDWRSLDERE